MAAVLDAAAALVDAVLHVADLLAGAGALFANLGALAAGVLVVLGAEQHKMGRGAADLGAGHHDPEVAGLDVLAANLQAVVHRRTEAGLVTAQALVDAGLLLLSTLANCIAVERGG